MPARRGPRRPGNGRNERAWPSRRDGLSLGLARGKSHGVLPRGPFLAPRPSLGPISNANVDNFASGSTRRHSSPVAEVTASLNDAWWGPRRASRDQTATSGHATPARGSSREDDLLVLDAPDPDMPPVDILHHELVAAIGGQRRHGEDPPPSARTRRATGRRPSRLQERDRGRSRRRGARCLIPGGHVVPAGR